MTRLSRIISYIWVWIWTTYNFIESRGNEYYQKDPNNLVVNLYYFIVYVLLSILRESSTVLQLFLITRGILKLNKNLHEEMIVRLIRAPINLFHDTKPKGQILNRLSKDLDNCTDPEWTYGSLIDWSFFFIGSVVVCSIFQVWCLAILPFLIFATFILIKFYHTLKLSYFIWNKFILVN